MLVAVGAGAATTVPGILAVATTIIVLAVATTTDVFGGRVIDARLVLAAIPIVVVASMIDASIRGTSLTSSVAGLGVTGAAAGILWVGGRWYERWRGRLPDGEAYGDGDVIVWALIGALLGPAVGLVAFVLASVIAGVMAAAVLLLRRNVQYIPLLPAITMATWLSLVVGAWT
jgi:prepilin signal peptidase PulO-like enzyme (type II secretory pathway)